MPLGRELRKKLRGMDTVQQIELVILIIMVVAILLLILAAVFLSMRGSSGDIKECRNVIFSTLDESERIPLQDTDHDGLGDIEENYRYGTNKSNPDSDGDGMGDAWEVKYQKKDKFGNWLVDPNDPTDAYTDPDNDGYDYNHNGYIDGSEEDKNNPGFDSVVLSKLKVPPHTDYTTYTLNRILSNLEEHKGEWVRIEKAQVIDNGSYREGHGRDVSRQITIKITDPTTNQEVPVVIRPYGNRPVNLIGKNETRAGDYVSVQGVFNVEGMNFWIEVRSTERFTNIMEYQAAKDYDGDGELNETSPINWDTDGDNMSDGWEIHYQEGYFNDSNGTREWIWIVHLDPTWPGDAYAEEPGEEVAKIVDIDGDRMTLPGGRVVGFNRDEYLTILDPETTQLPTRPDGSPIRNLAELLAIEDFNISQIAYGTDPKMEDTDRDSFDVDRDGYTPGVDTNCMDFTEIFVYGTNPVDSDTDDDDMPDGWEVYYGLNATNPNDRFEDPDGDLLQNRQEYLAYTNPKRWDTDDEGEPWISGDINDPAYWDGMPDGWEVLYGLDPLDNSDWDDDVDYVGEGDRKTPRPDGLINLYEYYNNTDPRNPDTDGDRLGDGEEVRIGWDIRVNGKMEHYYTCASKYEGIDTDKDDVPDDEDGDGYSGADEEYLMEGPDREPLDTDGDGRIDEEHDLNDWNEVTYYHTNASNPDTDGEGLSDFVELFTDREPDIEGLQTTDPCLEDTDGDGLKDNVEVVGMRIWLPRDVKPQLVVTSPLRLDTDNDGLKDGDEVMTDFIPPLLSGEKATPKLFQAKDGFFYPAYEPDIGDRIDSTDPTDPDTDDDGMPDGYEYDFSDLDYDGLPTWWENTYGFFKMKPLFSDTDGNGLLDSEEDFDDDGLSNLEEFIRRSDPLDPDSEIPGKKGSGDNGIKDGDEKLTDKWGHPLLLRYPLYSDSDGDLMPDWWEKLYDLNPTANDSWNDKDSDGLANIDEYIFNLNPEKSDTDDDGKDDLFDHPVVYNPWFKDQDDDGIGDWWEIYWFGSIDACDPDANDDGPWDPDNGAFGDNWTNFQEYYLGPSGWDDFKFRTNPKSNDTDGDGINDDVDPYPVHVPYVERPLNPVGTSVAMNPLRAEDLSGDMDQDGIDNLEEYRYPWGTLDPTDPDCDHDGMPDGWEVAMGVPKNMTGNQTGQNRSAGEGGDVIERILNPLDPSDGLADPDIDGIPYYNRTTRWHDYNGNGIPDSGEYEIGEEDFNGDGIIDPTYENESYCNIEEYWFGIDVDADGINENTTWPFKNDTDEDGMLDGFEVFFGDQDDDKLPNGWELMYGLDPRDPYGLNGTDGDPDNDGYTNWQEYNNTTNPRDPESRPIGRGNSHGRDFRNDAGGETEWLEKLRSDDDSSHHGDNRRNKMPMPIQDVWYAMSRDDDIIRVER